VATLGRKTAFPVSGLGQERDSSLPGPVAVGTTRAKRRISGVSGARDRWRGPNEPSFRRFRRFGIAAPQKRRFVSARLYRTETKRFITRPSRHHRASRWRISCQPRQKKSLSGCHGRRFTASSLLWSGNNLRGTQDCRISPLLAMFSNLMLVVSAALPGLILRPNTLRNG